MLLFDVVTHLGTLVAVTIVFAGTFGKFVARLAAESWPSFSGRRTAWVVALLGVIACAATAVIRLSFNAPLERAFSSVVSTGAGLLVTGTLLFISGRVSRPRRGWRRIGWWRALLVGVAQGIAIIPGISRSGSTICTGLYLGIKRRWAAQFSFLILVPAILGAGAIKLRDTFALAPEALSAMPWAAIVMGAVASLVSGVVALRILLAMVIADRLQHFCYYCWGLGAVVVGWGVVG